MTQSKHRLHSGRRGRWILEPAPTPEEPHDHPPAPKHPFVPPGNDASMPRVIVLTNDIDNDVVNYVAHHLAALNDISHDTIVVKICCPGGELHASWAIYDMLTTCPSPIVTVGYGFVGSGATLALLGGDIRMLGENAKLFIHDIQYGVKGSHTEMEKKVKESHPERARIAQLYERESGQPKTDILKWMKAETEMTARQAIHRGFADQLIPRRKVEVEIRGVAYNRPHTARKRSRKR